MGLIGFCCSLIVSGSIAFGELALLAGSMLFRSLIACSYSEPLSITNRFFWSLISDRVLWILFAPFGDKERSNQRIEPVGHFGLSNLFRSGAVTRSPFTLSLLITQHTSSQPNNRWNAHRLSFLTEPVRDKSLCLLDGEFHSINTITNLSSSKAQGH